MIILPSQYPRPNRTKICIWRSRKIQSRERDFKSCLVRYFSNFCSLDVRMNYMKHLKPFLLVCIPAWVPTLPPVWWAWSKVETAVNINKDSHTGSGSIQGIIGQTGDWWDRLYAQFSSINRNTPCDHCDHSPHILCTLHWGETHWSSAGWDP